MSNFLLLDPTAVAPEESRPAPDRLVSGDPVHRTWNVEDRDGLYAGVWESTPGEWRVEYTEWEYCEILAGVSVLSEDGGEARRVGPGDAFLLRPGFRGTWRVEETTRKRYVIRL